MGEDIFTVRYGLGKVIITGWNQYWKNFGSILLIFLIVYIPINIILSFIPVEELIDKRGFSGFRMYMQLIRWSEFFIGVLATMALARLIESSLCGQPITWKASLIHALSRWCASIGTGIIAGIITFGLLLLLIVPGVIWCLYYSLFIYVVSLRGLAGKRALDYSKQIVKGQWWRVLGTQFVIFVLSILACFVVSLPFVFLPDNQILDIVGYTLSDVLSALFLTMIIVFFVNNDYLKMGNERIEGRLAEPATDWLA